MIVPGGPDLVLSRKGTQLYLFWKAEGRETRDRTGCGFEEPRRVPHSTVVSFQPAVGLMALEGIRLALPYEGSTRDQMCQQELGRLGRLAWSCSVPTCVG